jgi:hypothetical protein
MEGRFRAVDGRGQTEPLAHRARFSQPRSIRRFDTTRRTAFRPRRIPSAHTFHAAGNPAQYPRSGIATNACQQRSGITLVPTRLRYTRTNRSR